MDDLFIFYFFNLISFLIDNDARHIYSREAHRLVGSKSHVTVSELPPPSVVPRRRRSYATSRLLTAPSDENQIF